MKVVCKQNNNRPQFLTKGKSYDVVGEGVFIHNSEPYYELICNKGTKIQTVKSNFKTLQEVRNERLDSLLED